MIIIIMIVNINIIIEIFFFSFLLKKIPKEYKNQRKRGGVNLF